MKLKIAVLMGGTSSESEVSLRTGQAMVKACEQNGHKTVPLVLEKDIVRIIKNLQSVDLVLIALHGGIGENGRLQGLFESLNIKYTGSNALSSAICMDKHISKLLVEDAGIATPTWQKYLKGGDFSFTHHYPCVVKPNSEGSTVGLTIVKNEDDLEPAINLAFEYDDEILIEKYISGKEITCAILDNKVLPLIEIKPSHELYDYECKYTKGLTQYICPAVLDQSLSDKIQKTSLEIFQLLKCRHYARLDFRLDHEGNHWFLESNTLPGMTDTSLVPKAAAAAGISFNQLIDTIVKKALNE